MASTPVPSPMAGSVKEVLVAVGGAVVEGQELLIVESMKMEIPIESPASGTVSEVLVAAGDSIDEDQVLFRLV